MSSLSVRTALGGAWSTHWLIWLGLLPVTVILTLFREQPLDPPSIWWSAVSALVQHAAVGVVVLGGGAIARRRRSILPLVTVGTIWMLAAISRAIVGFVISDAVYARPSSLLVDGLIWVAISIVWIPVTVYAVAQVDQRRLLIAAHDIAADALSAERAESTETTQQLQARLLATVTAQVAPLLADLEASLAAARGRVGGAAAAELGLRISRIHDTTADLVEEPDEPPTLPEPTRANRVTFRRAFDIDAVLPARAASVVTLAVLVTIVPDTLRVHGTVTALQVVLAAVAAGVLLAALPALFARRAARRGGLTQLRATALLQAIALVVAVGMLALVPPSLTDGPEVVVIPLTAVALVLAHTTVSVAFVMADANSADDAALRAMTAEYERLSADRAERSRQARERMAQLMHGPIQGRLAACVMALNFHAEIVNSDPERAEAMLTSVMEHLQGVGVELQRLSDTPAGD